MLVNMIPEPRTCRHCAQQGVDLKNGRATIHLVAEMATDGTNVLWAQHRWDGTDVVHEICLGTVK